MWLFSFDRTAVTRVLGVDFVRYLTEIRDKDGHSFPFLFVKIEKIGKYSFSAYDTETQKTVDVDTQSNCLGITTFKREEIEYVVAAVHNKKAAELYRFVECIDTQPIMSLPLSETNVVPNTLTLPISLHETMRILGEYGSVVIRMSRAFMAQKNMAYTLYDFLLNLCRENMKNVMSYETIRLVNINGMGRGDIMTIKLVHNPEANEFFRKMYARAWGSGFTQYVSDIRVDGKHVDHAIWPCVSNVVVITKNMDTGVTEEVINFPIDDCYGFSPRWRDGDCLIVCHTAQTAQLYKYIKSVKTYSEDIPEEIQYPVVDFCILGDCANFNVPQDAATRTLTLRSLVKDIYIYEPCGSTVRIDDYSVQYLSLYDFLILMCRLTGLNIMSYGTVRISCEGTLSDIEIMFHHGVEADRFFSKMYILDALGSS